ncbi:MAG: YncE family protein [Stackebrandtia sp.]
MSLISARSIPLAIVVSTALIASTLVADAPAATADEQQQQVLFVGNNWDGTVDVVTDDGKLEPVGEINIVPDLDERLAEIKRDPVKFLYYRAIREFIGEGHDQYVDDMYSTADGKLLVVSRPSLADVVGIDIASGEIKWRFPVEGHRSDHMALSPDGAQVAVSASTANTVHLLDVQTGQEEGSFATGDSPHENVYTSDGRYVFNASIGNVYTPFDHPLFGPTKGKRYFEVYDRDSGEVVKQINMADKLDEAGYEHMSASVRPMTFSPDGKTMYFQVSFEHGFFEYDLTTDTVKRRAELPIADDVQDVPREQYLLDSAHHGIAMNTDGDRICVAGTMSDYATIVDQDSLEHQGLIEGGEKPYWATRSGDSENCYVSWSGSDRVSAISYDTGKEVASVSVGDHPQRMRVGTVPSAWNGTSG